MAYDPSKMPSVDGVEQRDDWVAWGHGDTRTSTHAKHSKLARRHAHASSAFGGVGGGFSSRKRRRRRRIGRIVAVVVAALLVVLIICGCAFGLSAWSVVNDGQALMTQVSTLQKGLSEGDSQAMQESAAVIQEKADAMAREVSGPLWSVAACLPGIGTDISNARVLSNAVEDLATNALTPLAGQSGTLELGNIVEGKTINVAAIQQLSGIVSDSVPVVERVSAQVDELEEGSISKVNDIVSQAQTQIGGVDALLKGIDELAPYLSDVLGGNGERTYLVLAQTTSEIRPSGGFIGSVGTITFENGTMDLGDFSSFWECRLSGNRAVDTTEEEQAIFGESFGVNPGDIGITPNFVRMGQMAQEFWESTYDEDIDGAIALDSHVLSSFLALVGGITLDDGTEVDADNVVEYLGHDVYWKYFAEDADYSNGGTLSDAVFAEVAELAFNKIVDNAGSISLVELADALGSSAEEHRLMVWMADEGEEEAIEKLGASGVVSADVTSPETGLYLLSCVSSKLDWWQTCDVTYSKISENADGSKSYVVTATLKNTMTDSEVDDAQTYIKGDTNGRIEELVYLYAPAGGSITDESISSGVVDATYPLYGRDVHKVWVTIEPGDVATLTYKVTTSPNAEGELTFRQTPLAQG